MKWHKAARTKGAPPSLDQLDLFEASSTSGEGVRKAPLRLNKQSRDRQNSITKQSSVRMAKRSNALAETIDAAGALIDTRTAARRLGIGVSTLEKMRIHRRGPPFIKLARNVVRYRLSDIEQWILARVR